MKLAVGMYLEDPAGKVYRLGICSAFGYDGASLGRGVLAIYDWDVMVTLWHCPSALCLNST